MKDHKKMTGQAVDALVENSMKKGDTDERS
jgi:hypothetical protein